MPTLEETLRARLIAFGTTAQSRIYPIRMPSMNTLQFPLLVYRRISAPRQYTQEGHDDVVEPRIQYDCWGKTYTEMVTLSEGVKAALSGWKDDAANVGHCFIMFELDQWEEQTGLFKKMLDAQVGWKGN